MDSRLLAKCDYTTSRLVEVPDDQADLKLALGNQRVTQVKVNKVLAPQGQDATKLVEICEFLCEKRVQVTAPITDELKGWLAESFGITIPS